MPLTVKDDSRVINYYEPIPSGQGSRPVKRFCWNSKANSGGICWNNNPFCWEDVSIIVELGGGDLIPESVWDRWNKLTEKKRKRFVKIYLEMSNGHRYEEQKEITPSDLTIIDVYRTVVKSMDKVKIMVDVKNV